MNPVRLVFAFAVFHSTVPPASAQPQDSRPEQLLAEALTLVRGLPERGDYGNWAKPLAALRIANTMRLRGMTAEAAAALEECLAMNSRLGEPAIKDEILIEICRTFTLLGHADRARCLARECKFRNYQTVARYVIARTALEIGKASEAEAAILDCLGARLPENKAPPVDDVWTRALVRLAVRMNNHDLARRLTATINDALWRSAALADLAVSLAEQGQAEPAFPAAEEIRDAYMAVLAYARLAAVAARQKASGTWPGRAKEGLQRSVAKVPDATARDFALRIAAAKIASAGDHETAGQIASGIQNPAARLLAACRCLSPESLPALLDQLRECPKEDRSLMAEALAVACGGTGMAGPALEAASRVSPGWPRVRALCEAAMRLGETPARRDAAKLLAAAARSMEQVQEPGWRCCALVCLALGEHRLGNRSAAEGHLQSARGEALRQKSPEQLRAVLPQVVEAAVFTGSSQFVAHTVQDVLKDEPDAALRDRLLPLLAAAGHHAAAVAECSRKPLADDSARLLLAYHLAASGQVAAAAQHAATLRPGERAEALTAIARVQIAVPAAKLGRPRVVGVSSHGSWGSWLGRLERMGLDWDLMPFSAPFEDGPEGLAAKYVMLGYPGTGGHQVETSVAGIEHLRQYLYAGGGFLGICAGQFLATGRSSGQPLIPCDCVYLRGQGPHQVQMRKNHAVAAGLPPVVIIARMNGGFLIPRPGCEVIGWYDTIDRYAALVAAPLGFGRVVAFSPHPEGSAGLEPCDRLCINGTLWAIEGLP